MYRVAVARHIPKCRRAFSTEVASPEARSVGLHAPSTTANILLTRNDEIPSLRNILPLIRVIEENYGPVHEFKVHRDGNLPNLISKAGITVRFERADSIAKLSERKDKFDFQLIEPPTSANREREPAPGGPQYEEIIDAYAPPSNQKTGVEVSLARNELTSMLHRSPTFTRYYHVQFANQFIKWAGFHPISRIEKPESYLKNPDIDHPLLRLSLQRLSEMYGVVNPFEGQAWTPISDVPQGLDVDLRPPPSESTEPQLVLPATMMHIHSTPEVEPIEPPTIDTPESSQALLSAPTTLPSTRPHTPVPAPSLQPLKVVPSNQSSPPLKPRSKAALQLNLSSAMANAKPKLSRPPPVVSPSRSSSPKRSQQVLQGQGRPTFKSTTTSMKSQKQSTLPPAPAKTPSPSSLSQKAKQPSPPSSAPPPKKEAGIMDRLTKLTGGKWL